MKKRGRMFVALAFFEERGRLRRNVEVIALLSSKNEDKNEMLISCTYLDGELTEERADHIAERHPELLPEHRNLIEETLAAPDQVRRSARFGSARLFSRWYADFRNGIGSLPPILPENYLKEN
jgi:hypothetical protein